jgi:hypothetical protein
MRGGGATGAAGLATSDAGALEEAEGAKGGAAACTLDSVWALTGGASGRAATDADDADAGAAGETAGFTAGGAGGVAGVAAAGGLTTGRTTLCGVMNRGAGAGGVADFATSGAALAGGAAEAAGLLSTAGAAGRAGGAAGALAACCCFVISFNTSPGLEMWERSILVLISSASRPERAVRAGAACASAAARKWARTFSASCSSTELECVFFSVTPTTTRTSRIDLLLTSSSLARSLIRILLIRPFFAPTAP